MNWIIVTFCLIAGILIGENINVFIAVCFLLALLFITIIKAVLKHRSNLQIFVSLIAVCIGVISVNSAQNSNSLDDYLVHYVNITGTVISAPQKSEDNYRYIIDTDIVSTEKTKAKTNERILLTSDKLLRVNDTVNIGGFIKHISGAESEYSFDLGNYYKLKDIEYKIYAEDISYSDKKLRKYSPEVVAASLKNLLSELVYEQAEGENAAIFNAVLTGDKSALSDDLTEALNKSGAIRYIYSSYFFILICTFLMSLFSDKIGRNLRTYILMALILAVGIINSDRPAFVKASIYTAAILFAGIKFGYVYKPDLLCGVIIAMLTANPMLVHNGGFVLSVSASALIIIFGDTVRALLHFIKNSFMRSCISVGLICTIGLLPLMAYYFKGVAPYSIILIFIYIPVNIAIWICFFPATVMTKLFGSAPVLSQILSAALFAYKKLPYMIKKLPFSYIHLAVPDMTVVVIFALGLIAFYLKTRNKSPRTPLISAAVLSVVFVIVQIPRSNTVEMTFVNVGQGDGAVISMPYKENIIIDGGGGAPYSEYDPGAKLFVPYLISHGKTKIDAAFISHFHQDHVQGVIDAIKELDVEKVYAPDSMQGNEFRAETEQAARENGTEIIYISKDTEITFESGLVLEITVPDESVLSIGDENDTSLLINVKYGDVNCLFTGDMTKYSENSLINRNKAPEAEILKVAHHGSATSTGENWVKAVNPDISVISLGENNVYDFPRESVLEALKGTKIYRTDQNGDITIIADKNKIKKVKTYK